MIYLGIAGIAFLWWLSFAIAVADDDDIIRSHIVIGHGGSAHAGNAFQTRLAIEQPQSRTEYYTHAGQAAGPVKHLHGRNLRVPSGSGYMDDRILLNRLDQSGGGFLDLPDTLARDAIEQSVHMIEKLAAPFAVHITSAGIVNHDNKSTVSLDSPHEQ